MPITPLTPEPLSHMTSTSIENLTRDRDNGVVPPWTLIDENEWRDTAADLEPGDTLTVESSRRRYTDVEVVGRDETLMTHGGTGIKCNIPGSEYDLMLYMHTHAGCRVVTENGDGGPVESLVAVEVAGDQ